MTANQTTARILEHYRPLTDDQVRERARQLTTPSVADLLKR